MKLSIEQPLLDSRIRIYAPVPQEWPMGPMLVHAMPFHIGEHNLFSINRTLSDDLAIGTADKTLSPKLNAFTTCGCFMTNPVCCSDINRSQSRDCAELFPTPNTGPHRILFFRLDASRWQLGKK